jgi:NADH-quinone oxidoreductase subunit C
MTEPTPTDSEENGAAEAASGSTERSAEAAAVAGTGARLGAETVPTAAQLYGKPTEEAPGTTIVHTGRDGYLELCAALKSDGFTMIIGVSGVDYLTHPGRRLPDGITPERFEVVVELLSLVRRQRVRVRCQVPVADPRMPTLFDLWPGAEAHEREVYDMFGVVFDDHPDMTRILMPEDWEGHPLRKDYATGHVPVQFKEAPSGR